MSKEFRFDFVISKLDEELTEFEADEIWDEIVQLLEERDCVVGGGFQPENEEIDVD